MKILLSGFEPFGGENINPSWEAVKKVLAPAGIQLEKICLPVSFREAPDLLEAKIRAWKPEAVICLGQAGGRSGISLERIAVNLMDARIPDNEGEKPRDIPLCEEGPAAIFSTLPLRSMEAALTEADLPVQISNSAGLFVCNAVFYRAAHLAALLDPAPLVGFIHVPYLPEQAAEKHEPFLSLEEDIRGLEVILQALRA